MFRSLEENAAIVSKINLEKIEAFTGMKIDTLVFAGGASKGALWSQIVSDVTGCQIKIPKVTEATALGAAMSAGIGAGVYRNFEDAAQRLVKWDTTYTPNAENHKRYQEIRKKWERAYEAQRKLVDDMITTPMWKAPGL
jgi:autoinducer 2 (AI-2) kinase